MSAAEVAERFNVNEVGDAGVPKYARGFDDNTVPGFGVNEEDPDAVFGRQLQNASTKSDLSVTPMMVGGRRQTKGRRHRHRQTKRRRRTSQKGGGGKKPRSGGRKPRFQLTLKATIRMRSRSRSRSKQQR